ncbi:hypothetical protein HDV06_003665 [Boothiomyces sp. JEL0866]|nr:hypothetical protein HDV06_003665 [Boothiomyces sp. JEL0866]
MNKLEYYKEQYHLLLKDQDNLRKRLKDQENELSLLQELVYHQDIQISNLQNKPPKSPVQRFVAYKEPHKDRQPANNYKMYDTLADGTTVPRQCGDCFSARTSGRWCLDSFVKKGHICQKCYRRRRKCAAAGINFIPAHHCNHCKTTCSKVWTKHPNQIGLYLCINCSDKMRITCNILPTEPQSPVSTTSKESE